jgi:hypothetical protein
MISTNQGRHDVPQPPDPYALHEATLAKLRQQATGESPPPTPRKAGPARGRAENREVAPEGATNVFGSATGALYDLAASILSIGRFAVKWTLIGGTRLFVGMFRAAHWVMHEVTGGD